MISKVEYVFMFLFWLFSDYFVFKHVKWACLIYHSSTPNKNLKYNSELIEYYFFKDVSKKLTHTAQTVIG